ncbi:MAG: hypothetical protein ACAI43_25735 [Phycisphaerae bacterium]|nr:hypothetical protein [Tepidisphaeraceae bacterium]
MPSGTRGGRTTKTWLACWACGLTAAAVVLVALGAGSASAETLGFKGDGGSAKPAPVDPATAAARAKVVSAAILQLTKEYQAYLKDPKNGKVREKSDYFKENPSPDLTPDAVMRGLEQSVTGGGATEAYVKWQLLSGIPGTFSPDLNKRALAVYRRAPSPFTHPGMDKRSLSSAKIGKGEITAANNEFSAAVAKVAEKNHPILAYRDELYARLDKNGDSAMAGLMDVADRAGAGLKTDAFFDNVAAAIKSWALTGGNTSAVRAMTERIAGLKDAVGKEENKPFTKVADTKGVAKWTSEPTITIKKIDELGKFLESTASGPTGGGLKFKPDMKK